MSHKGPSKGMVRPQGFAASLPTSRTTPAGLGLDSVAQRLRMVERLRVGGIQHPAVLAAMAAVPRHVFVDPALASRAYDDDALPIGHQQTISQPWIVARMLELVLQRDATRRRWLEIGGGCGYQAAVMAQLAERIDSIERVAALAQRAKVTLEDLGVDNVHLRHGDGLVLRPNAAPYDAIVLAAAGLEVPTSLLAQLTPDGVLVAPVQKDNGQELLLVQRSPEGLWQHTRHGAVRFVPLLKGLA